MEELGNLLKGANAQQDISLLEEDVRNSIQQDVSLYLTHFGTDYNVYAMKDLR